MIAKLFVTPTDTNRRSDRFSRWARLDSNQGPTDYEHVSGSLFVSAGWAIRL